MEESNIVEFAGRDGISDPLTDLLRKGARQLLQSAIEAALETFIGQFAEGRHIMALFTRRNSRLRKGYAT